MSSESLLARARAIDPDRAKSRERELGTERGLAVLLSTAFPPLRPVLGWQVEALDEIARAGWRGRRQRQDLLVRLLAAVGELSDPSAVQVRLRRAVWAERARIALRELLPARLGGASIDVTAAELSDLAETAIEVALAEARQHVALRFAEPRLESGEPSAIVCLGMGKLGGHELNAGSDVDLIFVYDSDEGAAGELTLHDFWTRVVRRAVATIEAPTADGMVWRVDLRLRPEGSQGPIVNSVAASERYYETWGRLWERAAMLRARPVAGKSELGRVIERELIGPFVFRREPDPAIFGAMSSLVEQSRAELSTCPERDVKLGPGGIREAEFFVQSLQLFWGGREPSLRVTGTLPALNRLRARGFVTDREMRSVAGAYRFLRRVEHHIQWLTGVQTHNLPEAEHDLDLLARTLEHADGASLREELDAARARVHRLFRSLTPGGPPPLARHHVLIQRLDTGDPALVEVVEQTLGSADVAEHLRALARRPDGLFGSHTREHHPNLADQVLDAIAESPDPEQAARSLRSLLGRFTHPGAYVTLLADEPRALARLLWVVGASAFVSDAIVSRPELADVVLFGRDGVPDPRGLVRAEIDRAESSAGEDDYERRDRFVQAIRRAKRRVMVEVAVADLAGILSTRDATRLLSELADETVESAVRFEMGGAPQGLAVIAVGKLGGREIGYGSDLDVLFVYDPAAAPADRDPGEHFVRVAQRIIRLISEAHPAGPGYELDTRLRPSGSHGMLVTSLASFARYHGVALTPDAAGPAVQSSGAPWERQALIRARGCAGDPGLVAQVMRVAARAAYEAGAPPVEEMHRLRSRMEVELGRERDGRYDLKTGRGGLLDIEFLTQWLQMRHGKDPRVRSPDTGEALEALASCGYLPRPEFETLREAYAFLRRLEQRIHVLHATSATVLDVRAPGLTQLARRMGMHDSGGRTGVDELLERYRDVTDAVRGAYERVLAIPA
ncbi:MAG: bifunctional [glutamate--ammonia ligase]-adenylyl-L-tyrosine phosphorylase/[glutamate--ammonia-ligase] adenylyltransferase [Polyangiaceae bacterium]|nr:bifunctional [glutamate--ammonia ligase]-adenylyl-L-tyrosine phosphorylase/[glutamate--ammonia-ligase] adenylyltransferase [Polyangiaceae bacterium]